MLRGEGDGPGGTAIEATGTSRLSTPEFDRPASHFLVYDQTAKKM